MNLKQTCCALFVVAVAFALSAMEPVVVFRDNFENPAKTKGRFGINYKMVDNALVIANTEVKSTYIAVQLPASQFAGCQVRLSARIKGENISAKPKSWNGAKLQFDIKSKSGKQNWQGGDIPDGSFAYQDFGVTVQLPDDLESLSFIIGLEECSGQVFYDDITVTVLAAPAGWTALTDAPAAPQTPAASGIKPVVVFCDNFENPVKTKGYFGTNYKMVDNALVIANAEVKSTYIAVPLSASQFAGCQVRLSARIKGVNISAKPKSWSGGKLQFDIKSKSGKHDWQGVEVPDGSFAYQDFGVTVQLPNDLEKLSFIIGLEECSGQVFYDDITLTVLSAPANWKFPEEGPLTPEEKALLAVPMEKSTADKAWPESFRGVTYPAYEHTYPVEEQFQQLKKWNVNAIRLWLDVDQDSPWAKDPDFPIPADDPLAPYRKNLRGLQIALALGQKYHIYVIPVAGGSMWRGRDDMIAKSSVDKSDAAQVALQEKSWQKFVDSLGDLWVYIAKNYGDNPWLLSYDLFNEPHTPREVKFQNDFYQKLIQQVRAVDKNTWLTIEPGPWALPDQAFETIEPITGDKLVYSFHFYYPHTYTHQNINSYKGEKFFPKPYPGELRLFESSPSVYWDKAALEKSMANAIKFQKENNVKIWIGEFGVARWAPGADAWYRDSLDLFEKYNWSWTLHCYGNQWNGWNPTFDANDPQSAIGDGGKDTPSIRVLKEFWQKNPVK